MHHGGIAGREAEQSCHAHVEGVLKFHILLPSQGMGDGRLEGHRKSKQFCMRSCATGARQDRDAASTIQYLGRSAQAS